MTAEMIAIVKLTDQSQWNKLKHMKKAWTTKSNHLESVELTCNMFHFSTIHLDL